MTEDELRRIEAELRLALPEDYRRLVLAYPFSPPAATACTGSTATRKRSSGLPGRR